MGTDLFLLFPGQGTEAPGMSRGWESDDSWNVCLERAESATGIALRQLMASGSEEALHRQSVAPHAVLAHALGVYAGQRRRGMPMPMGATGHSLGFYTAAIAAGLVPQETAHAYIQAVEHLSTEYFATVPQGMAVVIGLRESVLREHLEQVPDVWITNHNSAAQFTLSGPRNRLERLVTELAPLALRAMLLPVEHPLHGPSMGPLVPRLARHFDQVRPGPLAFPLLSFVNGRLLRNPHEAWDEFLASVALPVHWPRTVQQVSKFGGSFWECGFGNQLSQLSRWTDRDLRIQSLQVPREWVSVEAS